MERNPVFGNLRPLQGLVRSNMFMIVLEMTSVPRGVSAKAMKDIIGLSQANHDSCSALSIFFESLTHPATYLCAFVSISTIQFHLLHSILCVASPGK